MKTFILCGGEGTRLRPYTYTMPKPMLPIAGKPIVQYVIENLKKNNLTDIILAVGYKKESIIDYFGDGRKIGVKIEYLIEDEPKNTAGAVLPCREKIKENFCVVMGDHLTNVNMRAFVESHKKSGAIATVGVQKYSSIMEYGVVDLNGETITGLSEKPVIEKMINTGIYAFKPEIFNFIKEKEDFSKDVFPRLLKSGQHMHGFVFNESWFDIGRVSDYERLKEAVELAKMAGF